MHLFSLAFHFILFKITSWKRILVEYNNIIVACGNQYTYSVGSTFVPPLKKQCKIKLLLTRGDIQYTFNYNFSMIIIHNCIIVPKMTFATFKDNGRIIRA